MTLLIIHLSDIHIFKDSDSILSNPEAIAKSTFSFLSDATAVVILISGDIAQSGLLNEYELAQRFFLKIHDVIKSEKDIPIHFIIAPGNHDCDFSDNQEIRNIIINNILKEPSKISKTLIDTAVSVQKNYFNFRNNLQTKELDFDDSVWTATTLNFEGKTIEFSCLNASWMSQRHEQQGDLIFPYEMYLDKVTSQSDLKVCVFHHPLNWYNQSNFNRFRGFLHSSFDIIVTGHEHYSNGREISDARNGTCIYIEGAALFERSSGDSEFNILVIDLEQSQIKYQTLRFDNSLYIIKDDHDWSSWKSISKSSITEKTIGDKWYKKIIDAGVSLSHPTGKEIFIDDIYVYPDFDLRIEKKTNQIKNGIDAKPSSRLLIDIEKIDHNILIEGDELSGKTKLLHKLFMDYHQRGFYPLYLDGSKIKSSSSDKIETIINNALKEQYYQDAIVAFKNESKSKKILLIDNFDNCSVVDKHRTSLIRNLNNRFERILVTVGQDYELTELASDTDAFKLIEFKQFRISPLGHVRRSELIKKWNSIGIDESVSTNQLLKACDDAEKLIQNFRLQHVASTIPIFILSLLQGTASGMSGEIHNSSFASYYYFLIVASLGKANVKGNDTGLYLSACTHLSWYIKKNGLDGQITEDQFKDFVKKYSDEWTETSYDDLSKTLELARIIEISGHSVRFYYPYAYYYFIGKYISISLENPEVNEFIDFSLKHLYVRECANALLFLAHHSGTSDVLDKIISEVEKSFSEFEPVTLDKDDVKVAMHLASYAPSLKYKALNPEQYRENNSKINDNLDNGDDGLKEKPSENGNKMDFFEELISLSKSMEIAGALLSHQFSNYKRNTKNNAINSIFQASLRTIRKFFSFFDNEPDQLVKAISVRVKANNKNLTSEQAEHHTRMAIGLLIRAIAYCYIMRAGTSLSAKELKDNIDGVVAENTSPAYKLIKIAQLLSTPDDLPRVEIKRLLKDHHDNPLVFGVLQFLVLNRLYMYKPTHEDQSWALSTFGLDGMSGNLQVSHQKNKQFN